MKKFISFLILFIIYTPIMVAQSNGINIPILEVTKYTVINETSTPRTLLVYHYIPDKEYRVITYVELLQNKKPPVYIKKLGYGKQDECSYEEFEQAIEKASGFTP